LARSDAGAVGDAEDCVSTATVGWPNCRVSTTFAVLAADAGQALERSRLAGTSPPCSSSRIFDSRHYVLRLGAVEPIRRMYFSRLATPSLTIFSGVSNRSNSTALAWFTDLSVAWADSTTATSSYTACGT